jgi:hypothetical protein
MEKQTFGNWIKATYDRSELEDIATHGCMSGVGGMIYYHETNALYDLHAEELHDMLYEYEQSTGEVPQFIIENLGCLTGFKNAMVWFCAELMAQELTNEECEA